MRFDGTVCRFDDVRTSSNQFRSISWCRPARFLHGETTAFSHAYDVAHVDTDKDKVDVFTRHRASPFPRETVREKERESETPHGITSTLLFLWLALLSFPFFFAIIPSTVLYPTTMNSDSASAAAASESSSVEETSTKRPASVLRPSPTSTMESEVLDLTQSDDEEEQEEDDTTLPLLYTLTNKDCRNLKIVGIRFYRGVAYEGEYVRLAREP